MDKATEPEAGGEYVGLYATTYYNMPRLHVPKYVERKKLSARLEELVLNGSTPCL